MYLSMVADAKDKDKENVENPSFETLTRRLEEVVEALESGGIPLDESLKLFEEGVRLSRKASRRLEEAERRVEELLEDGQEKDLKGFGAQNSVDS